MWDNRTSLATASGECRCICRQSISIHKVKYWLIPMFSCYIDTSRMSPLNVTIIVRKETFSTTWSQACINLYSSVVKMCINIMRVVWHILWYHPQKWVWSFLHEESADADDIKLDLYQTNMLFHIWKARTCRSEHLCSFTIILFLWRIVPPSKTAASCDLDIALSRKAILPLFRVIVQP